jgi:CBS domain containing-hemolysin-like protein
LFRFLLAPAIFLLNGLGNLVLRLFGLKPGTSEGLLHSPEELRLLARASAAGGLLHEAQEEVVARVFSIGERTVGDAMTPRVDIAWINAEDSPEEILRTVRECRHEQIVVSQGEIDNVIGVVRKQDILDQALDSRPLDPLSLVKEAAAVYEAASLLSVFEQFKRRLVRLAIVVDEYGALQGIVTPTDLMEAIAGEMPTAEEEKPEVVKQADGSLLMAGRMNADEAFERLAIERRPDDEGYRTLAGFAIRQLRRIPAVGDRFDWQNWQFEVAQMSRRRIEQLRVSRSAI